MFKSECYLHIAYILPCYLLWKRQWKRHKFCQNLRHYLILAKEDLDDLFKICSIKPNKSLSETSCLISFRLAFILFLSCHESIVSFCFSYLTMFFIIIKTESNDDSIYSSSGLNRFLRWKINVILFSSTFVGSCWARFSPIHLHLCPECLCPL